MLRRWISGGTAVITAALALLLGAPVSAQNAALAQLSNWYISEVQWRSAPGLPVSMEFIAPLTASYNWAYGATLLGVNVRSTQEAECFAAVAWLKDGQLEGLDSEGPLSNAAQWDSGPYHLAAALPDGRLIVWLTAPGEYPQAFTFSNSLQPGTAFDCEVFAPDPPGATWSAWRIIAAFQYAGDTPNLIVETQDGNGVSYGYHPALKLPGSLRSVSYCGYPATTGAIPGVLYTCVRDRQATPGNSTHLVSEAAWFDVEGGRWYGSSLRYSGLNGGSTAFCAGPEIYGMLLGDNGGTQGDVSFLQLVTLENPSTGAIKAQLGRSCDLPALAQVYNASLLVSARSSLPLLAFSDEKDLWLGCYRRGEAAGAGLPYDVFMLHEGEIRNVSGEWRTAYPIAAVAAAAHWSTGDPEVFFIQQGNWLQDVGTLMRLSYEPQR